MSNVATTNSIEPISNKKETWIPYSPTPAEYTKLGLEPRYFDEDDKRDGKTRLVKGNYKRKISAIYIIRTDDDKKWLNWNETREGKTPMQRKISFEVTNMGIKKIPIPKEETIFDKENEEYQTVITGEREYRSEYFIEFTPERLAELLEDINPYKTQYMIGHIDQRTFTVTKAEIQQAGKDFAKLYDSKLNRSLVSK